MFWLILSCAVWGLVHSWMASLGFKELLRRMVGDGGAKFYRLFYNVFSVISIAPIFYLMLTLPDKDFYRVPMPWSSLMLAGQGLAVLLLFAAVLQTDVLAFVGLRQLFEEQRSGKLVTSGFYRGVRHPLYTFGLLILWLSASVSLYSFTVYLALTIYILVVFTLKNENSCASSGRNMQTISPLRRC